MSSFTELKQKRQNSGKSYGVASPTTDLHIIPNQVSLDVDEEPENRSVVEVKPGSVGQTSHKPETPVSLPRDLEIRVHKGDEVEKGRGIYSQCGRRPGEILIATKPHVSALSNDHLEGNCSNCFTSGSSLRRCTGCKTLFYCDSDCQKMDWALHKQECAAIQRWTSGTSTIPGDAVRCLGRILWKKRKVGRDSTWTKEVDSMQSHRISIGKEPDSHDPEVYAQLAHAVVRFLGLASPQEMAEYGIETAADLVDLVSRFTTNTFTISTSALAPLGACVSPLVALINHSCDPNAVVVFPHVSGKEHEPMMHVVALKPICPDEEILISYVDTTLPQKIRQKQLRETYHFNCRCDLCSPISASIDLREAMFCPKKCGRVCVLPTEETNFTQCPGCKATEKDTDAIIDAIRVGQEALDKAEALQFSNPEKSIQLTTNFIRILTAAELVPAAHPLLALSRLNTSLLISRLPAMHHGVEESRSPEVESSYPSEDVQEALDEAIRGATRSWTGLTQLLPEGHPVRSVALAELGKLLCVDEPYPKSFEAQNSTGKISAELPTTVTDLVGAIQSPASLYPPSGPARLQLAYETLLRARSELMIGFGGGKNDGGELGRVVRQMTVDVEKELSIWREGIRNVVKDSRLTTKASEETYG